jgi:hypothetical protein
MRASYDFSNARPNPYAKRLKKQVTLRLDEQTIGYFKRLADETGDKQHHAPHVHAECSGDEAVFAILTGEALAGELPSGKTRLVQAWIEIHRDELMADWQLAVCGEEIFKIDPLK